MWKSKPKETFRDIVDVNLDEKFDIVFVSSYEKSEWYVLEVEHLITKEKMSFMHKPNGKSMYGWYVLPHLEKLEYKGLYKHLSRLQDRDVAGMYDIIKKENAIRFISDD
ncbi:hypothetical protein N9948_00840 [bacterium]|nr:hypothetical protein [bacterium]